MDRFQQLKANYHLEKQDFYRYSLLHYFDKKKEIGSILQIKIKN